MNPDLVTVSHLRFGYRNRPVLSDVNMRFAHGKITALIGGSGSGKTTILRLVGGLLRPQEGEVVFDGQVVNKLDRDGVYAVRRRMGMLYQFGALFTDLSVFDNVAFPLREHTNLPENMIRDLVLLKLNAVGLRGAARFRVAQLSGGMARRVALSRAIALDPPLIMYDEPFTGLDPIAVATVAQLIRQLNTSLNATAVVVSHDIKEAFAIADYVYLLAAGRITAEGTPDQMRQSTDPNVRQFLDGSIDGPVAFHYASSSTLAADLGVREMSVDVMRPFRFVGDILSSIGYGTRFFFRLCGLGIMALRRPRLVLDQIHFIGNYSLSIILVSGLLIGFVLGLQGYYTLRRYGSEEALGLLVALSLVRELGPVVTALLFAGRAGTSLTAEVGLMKAGEQIDAMEMMAVDPVARVLAPRFIAAVICMPLLAALFSSLGILGGYIVGVSMIGIDAGSFWSQMQGGVDWLKDVGNGVLKSIVFGFTISFVSLFVGYEAEPTPEGVSRGTTTTVVVASLAVLGLDFILTALMFSAS